MCGNDIVTISWFLLSWTSSHVILVQRLNFFSPPQDLESDLEALIGIAPDLDGPQGLVFVKGVGWTLKRCRKEVKVTWIHKLLQDFKSSTRCMYTIPATTNAIILVLLVVGRECILEDTANLSLILARRPKYIQIG